MIWVNGEAPYPTRYTAAAPEAPPGHPGHVNPIGNLGRLRLSQLTELARVLDIDARHPFSSSERPGLADHTHSAAVNETSSRLQFR